MIVTTLFIVLLVIARKAQALRNRGLGHDSRPDLGALALRELKTTRYTLLRADSVMRHLWIQAPAPTIAPLRDAVLRERFRQGLQRRINLWGYLTALVRGRRWRRVTLTLRMRPGPVVRIAVSPVDTAAPMFGRHNGAPASH